MSRHSSIFWCAVLLISLECFLGVVAEDGMCYTSGSVAGIVIATIVVTLVMGALAAAFVWYLWRLRKAEYSEDKSAEKPIACPPMSPDKQLIVKENSDYAFDNPYFKDDEVDQAKHDAAEKGESGFHLDNGDITPSQKTKQPSNGTTGGSKKNRPFSSLPFHVFHPSGKKQRATMDDTYITKHHERITVPLRGHDFTGLGFNICGNMRDGIFIKDVLHRGPASESGKIKAGDRIVGVTVSFGAMVYEDALTILSYASPYDVRLEIEKCSAPANGALPSASPKKLGASTSFRTGDQRRLFHPLYRSQSIDDLTQIGKDSGLDEHSPGIRERNQKSSNTSSATPKRSQSVEASNGGPKSRSSAYSLKNPDESKSVSSSSKGSRKSSISSCDSTGKIITASSVPLPEKSGAPKEEIVKKEVKSSRFRVEQINVKSEAPEKPAAPPVKPVREATNATDEQKSGIEETEPAIIAEKPPESVSPPKEFTNVSLPAPQQDEPQLYDDNDKPTAPPRRTNTPAKRKAPAPPPTSTPSKTETAAVVHREDETAVSTIVLEASADVPPPPPTTEVPGSNFSEKEPKKLELELGSSDTSSLASGPVEDQQPSSPGKRKASSLGDLTKLDQESNKKTSVSTAVLERAVSMDLQQSMPGENLVKQKKILRAPTFEDDYDENKEGDTINEIDGPSSLKRWDDGLDNGLGGLTNGHQDTEDMAISSPAAEKETNSPQENEDILEIPQTKTVVTIDLDVSSNSESSLKDDDASEKQLTSTPTRKVIEVKGFLKDDDISLDEVPYLGSVAKSAAGMSQDESTPVTTKQHTIRTSSGSGNTSIFSPVTISIPIIKPDLKQFEKLSSPPIDTSWRLAKTSPEEGNKSALERISVQSLYRPIFSSKDSIDPDEPFTETPTTEKLVNGNDSDSSIEHGYSTAQENTTVSSVETSTLSISLTSNNNNEVTLTTSNNNNNDPTVVSGNSTNVKTPNNAAGFAKTLIVPGPNEVENLLSLAAEPITPPPQMDKPPKPIENE